METFVVFVAVVGAGSLVGAVLSGLPGLRGALAWLWRGMFFPVAVACRMVSAIADFFLSPKGTGRRISRWKYAVWVLAGLLPLAAFFLFVDRPDLIPAPLRTAADPGYLLVAAGAFHVLVLSAALLALHEDYDVMDGIVSDDRRRIRGARSATRASVMAISALLFLAYAAAVVYWLVEVRGVDLLDKRPATGVAAVDYLLIVLWSLPTELLLRLIDWLLGADTSVVFKATPVARTGYFTIYAIGSFLLAGLAAVSLQMALQLRRIVTEIAEGREGEHFYLMARARLAPPVIKRGILRAAISPRDKEQQKRLIDAARDLAIFTFPQTFCHHLESYDEEIQQAGLERSIELFRQHSAEFEREPSQAILRKTGRVLRRGKLGDEPTKRLLRLMIAVLTAKRGVVQIDAAYRDSVAEAINKRLRMVGAEGDPALRGLLQDLRGALARAVVVKAAAPVAQPEGRAAPPGDPATTALR